MSDPKTEKPKRLRRSAAELAREAAALKEKAAKLEAKAEAQKAAEEASEAQKKLRRDRTRAHIILGAACDKLGATGKLDLMPLIAAMSERDRKWMEDFMARSKANLSRAGQNAPAPGGTPAASNPAKP